MLYNVITSVFKTRLSKIWCITTTAVIDSQFPTSKLQNMVHAGFYIYYFYNVIHFHVRGNNACEYKKNMVICHGHDSRTIFSNDKFNTTYITI